MVPAAKLELTMHYFHLHDTSKIGEEARKRKREEGREGGREGGRNGGGKGERGRDPQVDEEVAESM